MNPANEALLDGLIELVAQNGEPPLEAARRMVADAKRYRFLRDELVEWKPAYYDGGQRICSGKKGRFDLLWPHDESNLDAAIDTAMQEDKG